MQQELAYGERWFLSSSSGRFHPPWSHVEWLKNGDYQWDIINHRRILSLFFFSTSLAFSLSLPFHSWRKTNGKKKEYLYLGECAGIQQVKETKMMTIVAASTACAQHYTRKPAHNEETRWETSGKKSTSRQQRRVKKSSFLHSIVVSLQRWSRSHPRRKTNLSSHSHCLSDEQLAR